MQQVGRYPLRATLGSGGFGTVYLAVDPSTGEQVAVKVLDWPDLDDRRAMFRQEVAALLSVTSPHVVRVRDVIDQPGIAAIVTDYVEGASLRQVLDRQGPLTGPQALSVLSGALRGLAAVHAAGLVHADLKPENILLDRSGSSRLIDFGIAGPPRALGGPDTWIGTPAYLAPEVVLGQHIDLRSDLYAVAATLFELLAGRPPYVGPNPVATALLHVQAPVPDLRAMQAGVHEHLSVLCAQDLAKDPVWRHQNTPAFLASLDLAATAAFGPDWATGTAVASATASVGALVGATLAVLPHAGVGLLGAAPLAGPLAAGAFGAAGLAGGGAAGGLAGGGVAGGGFAGGGFAGGGAAGGFAGGGAAGGLAGGGAAGGFAGGGAGAAGAAGAAGGAGGAGTLGGAAAAGAGGSGVAGTGGGIAASAGGVKAAIAAAAAVATIGAGAATVVVLQDDDEPAAQPPYVPALVAAYTTQPVDTSDDLTASVVTNEGRTVRIRDIGYNHSTGGPAWGVHLASDRDGRSVVAIDGRRIAAVSGSDAGTQSSIDCSCTALAAAPDGTYLALTVDSSIDRFRVSDGEIERVESTPIQDAPGAELDPQAHYVDSILSVQADAAVVTLPADTDAADDGYYRSVLSRIDLTSGEITASEDTGIGSTGLAATSASGRYVAYKEYPGDGCLDGSITVVDLERTGADGPFAMSRFTGPDGQDQYRGTPGELNAVAFDGEELLAAYRPGGSCGAEAGPSRYYRTTIGDVGSPADPIVSHAWQRDGRELGISWRATAHDGRSLGAWETGRGDDLWIGSPRAGGTRVARQVGTVIAIGQPGTPEETEAGPPTQQEVANLVVPAGACGDGGSYGWNQVKPIQLVDGVGEAFVDADDPSAGGASIFEVKLLGSTDVTGDQTPEAIVQLQCSGSPQALCCAGRASILYGIVALDLSRPDPVLVGDPLWGTDEADESRQILSARLAGQAVVTQESFIYDSGTSKYGSGTKTFRYRFSGGRWVRQ